MKKIAICLAMLGTSFLVNAKGSFHVVKSGGGPNGYSRVEQDTDESGNTNLNCTSPGNDQCSAVNPPKTSSAPEAAVVNNLLQIVDAAVSEGTLSGETTYDGLSVTWSGLDVYNYVLDIR